jgi:hypothetical protein
MAGGRDRYSLTREFLYKKYTNLSEYVFYSVPAFIQRLTDRQGLKTTELPKDRQVTNKDILDALTPLKSYRYYEVEKGGKTLLTAATEIEKEFKDNLLLDFLSLVMEKPSYLLGTVSSKTHEPNYYCKGKKGDRKVAMVRIDHLNELPCLFDKLEHMAFFLWSLGKGTDDFHVEVDGQSLTITIKDFKYVSRPTSDKQQQAVKVGVILNDIAKLTERDVFRFYESVVRQKSLVLGAHSKGPHTWSGRDDRVNHLKEDSDDKKALNEELTLFSKGCIEMKLEAHYSSFFLPTINMEEIEEDLREYTKNVQMLRAFYDKYRGRYPASAALARKEAVQMICDEPMDYLLFPDKAWGVNELAKIVLEGYSTEKIMSRYAKL